MSDSAELVVREFIASWVECNPEELARFFTEDAVSVDGPQAPHRGVKAIKAAIEAVVANTPGFTVDINEMVSDGDTVMVERVDRFEMEGKPFAVDVMGIFKVDGNGRIERWRDYYDLRSIEDQVRAAGISIPS